MSDLSTSAALQKLQEFYASDRFQEGIDLLLETRSQWQSARFHELLGSFHMKLENFAVARYHFELAVAKGNLSPAVQNNLDYVLQQMGLTAHAPQWFDRTVDTLSMWPFEIWATLTLILLALSFWKLRARWQHGSRVFAISLWLAALVPQIVYWGVFAPRVHAVALEDIPLYEGPSALFSSVKTLRAGEKVLIDGGSEGWSFVTFPSVMRGWVKSEKLGFIGRGE